jgi:hypothetical protein
VPSPGFHDAHPFHLTTDEFQPCGRRVSRTQKTSRKLMWRADKNFRAVAQFEGYPSFLCPNLGSGISGSSRAWCLRRLPPPMEAP